MMEAVHTSETSVDNHFTWQYIPEDNSEHDTACSLDAIHNQMLRHLPPSMLIFLLKMCNMQLALGILFLGIKGGWCVMLTADPI
jgi:hypothetical protein